jgi:serine acetyltransferase
MGETKKDRAKSEIKAELKKTKRQLRQARLEELDPRIRRVWAPYREQYNAFMADVLVPRGRIKFIRFTKIYAAYEMYCKAVGWEPIMSRTVLGTLLTENFNKQTSIQVVYGCDIRPGVFLDTDGGVIVEEKVHG